MCKIVTMASRSNDHASTRLIEYTNDSDEFVSYQGTNNKLEVFRIRGTPNRELSLVSSKEFPNISCMEFNHINTNLQQSLAIGSSIGSVLLVDVFGNTPDVVVNNTLKYGRRPCTGVSWVTDSLSL